jgi:hypothetical protein
MESLFPDLPEDLSTLSDEELAGLLREHQVVAEGIEAESEDLLAGLSAEEVIATQEQGVEQIQALVDEQKARKEREAEYLAKKNELAERRRSLMLSEAGEGDDDEGDGGGDGEEQEEGEEAELSAEGEGNEESQEEAEEGEEQEAETAVLVADAGNVQSTAPKTLRRPPAPSRDRLIGENAAVMTAAAGLDGIRGGQPFDRLGLAEAIKTVARRLGPPSKSEAGIEQRFFVGQAVFPFPEDRRLMPGEADSNARKVQAVIPPGVPGVQSLMPQGTLVASGGLCAPLENVYSMPNFAVQSRPVRDALPSFQADRGGVNVPAATIIGDITTAISVIEESEDALGGTFATKSCQDLTCPAFTETAVTVIAHCREYGNLNARAWPEKIAHENDLTMAAHARTAEAYLLDRIKALSINVTAATVLGAFADLVDAILKAQAGMRYRMRMNPETRFRVLMPSWVPELLSSDWVRTQNDRIQPQDAAAALLSRYRITVAYYLDTPSTGTSQGFANEAAGALDEYPADVQWAIFPEGEFIHLDGGTLDLGLVRDSTLNSTNDFQIFGENFENVARIGPAQGALWVTSTVTASGEVRAPA